METYLCNLNIRYYKITISLSLLFIAFSFFKVIAQDSTFTEYKGTVRDALTKDPIAFASLSLQGTNIASVTNSEGEFSLKVTNDKTQAKVEISAVGYQKLLVTVSEFRPVNTIIEISPRATELSEVSVKRPKSAEGLVKSVFANRAENYLNTQSQMTAFYRETIKKRRTNVSLAEAVVNIKKKPYTNNGRDLVDLFKARKLTNYDKLDTLALKLEGGPFNALYADVIKYPEFFLTPESIPQYDFTFGKSTLINDELIYVVDFKQKNTMSDPLYYGSLYINANSLALTNAIYSLNVEDRTKASKLFVRKKPNRVKVWPTLANYRVDYREKDGKWFYGYSNIQLEFVVNWRKRLFNSRYGINSEMLVTDWEKENTPIAENAMENFKLNSILADEASGFADPDFWGAYNVIEPEKSIESAISKIRRQLRRDNN